MTSPVQRLLAWAGLGLVLATLTVPAHGFESGTPLSLTIDPATIRQKDGKEYSRVSATVVLKDPSPAYFVCVIRSPSEGISFPAIIFRKGDQTGTTEGTVRWKLVQRETHLRVAAYNSDAPDRRLTFTVTLAPAG